jgi:hypothetical protein
MHKSWPWALGFAMVSGGIAVPSAGCVIFLNPDVPGEHCGFKGTGDCATCLRENCETAIDACCNDEECSDDRSYALSTILQLIDICGEGNDAPRCAYESSTGITSGNEGVVRACLKKSCATECFGNGRSHTKCDLKDGGSSCKCADDKESSGPACNKESVKGTCALTKRGCTCGEYSCSSGNRSCSCGFGGIGESKTCQRPASKSTCCLAYDAYGEIQCTCDFDGASCRGADEVPITSCNETEVLRVLGKGVVDSCSY